jgi:hypothetical protein
MQLELDLAAVIEPDMTPEEIEAIAADFLARYSSDVRTNGALRSTPCQCDPDGIGHFDPEDYEKRCIKCGRSPSASSL